MLTVMLTVLNILTLSSGVLSHSKISLLEYAILDLLFSAEDSLSL
jgi:hypothetical protein